jgi:putative component of toxin-antitoxin plasmid stabilization module
MVEKGKILRTLPRHILKYVREDLSCPYDKRYKNFNIALQAAIDEAISRIEQGRAVKLKRYGTIAAIVLSYPTKIRIYLGEHSETTVLLLVGTEKRQNKDIRTAQDDWDNYSEDTEAAKKYWEDYLKSQ